MSKRSKHASTKLLVPAALGVAVGYGGGAVLAGMLDTYRLGGGAVALALAGLIYLGVGMLVAIGTALPRLGARMLNVADGQELRDMRLVLLASGWAMAALGLGMVLLALSGPGAPVPAGVGLAAIAAGCAVAAAATWRSWPAYDELWRALSLEGSGMTAALLLPALCLWGGLVHAGVVPGIDPLGLFALAATAMLAGSMIAAGRRGLMRLR